MFECNGAKVECSKLSSSLALDFNFVNCLQFRFYPKLNCLEYYYFTRPNEVVDLDVDGVIII